MSAKIYQFPSQKMRHIDLGLCEVTPISPRGLEYLAEWFRQVKERFDKEGFPEKDPPRVA